MPSEPYKLPLRIVDHPDYVRVDVIDAQKRNMLVVRGAQDIDAVAFIVHAANTLPEALRLIGELKAALQYEEGCAQHRVLEKLAYGASVELRARRVAEDEDVQRLRAALARADKFIAEQEAK